MIWVVDMYRAVIEHPEWIPQAWQQQIDLRAGCEQGRIYRVVPTDASRPDALAKYCQATSQRIDRVAGERQRDAARHGPTGTFAAGRQVNRSMSSEASRRRALRRKRACTPCGRSTVWKSCAIANCSRHSATSTLEWCETRFCWRSRGSRRAIRCCGRWRHWLTILIAKVKLQLALTLGESTAPAAGGPGKNRASAADDAWLAQAIVSSSKHHSLGGPGATSRHLRNQVGDAEGQSREVTTIADLIATAGAPKSNPSTLVARAIADADADARGCFHLPRLVLRRPPGGRNSIRLRAKRSSRSTSERSR